MTVKNYNEMTTYMDKKKQERLENLRKEMQELKEKGYPDVHPEIVKEAIPMWDDLIHQLENRDYWEARITLHDLYIMMGTLMTEMEEIEGPPLFKRYKNRRKTLNSVIEDIRTE